MDLGTAERLVSTVLPMGTIAGPGSHLPINRCDRPKRFRSWLSRSEPIPTIRNAASGHAKKYAPSDGRSRDFFCPDEFPFLRVPAAVMALGKKQGPRYPGTKTCCALPRTQQTVDLRHLGPCDRSLSVDLQKLHPCGLCRPTGTQLQGCPRNLDSSEDSLSHLTAVRFFGTSSTLATVRNIPTGSNARQ